MELYWLPVVGFEGLYEVSNYGQIRTLAKWKGFVWKFRAQRTLHGF